LKLNLYCNLIRGNISFPHTRKIFMNSPIWLKPALTGAVVGAIAIAIVGFSWGGWVTAQAAKQMADAKAHSDVLAALVPICLEQSKQDPKVEETLTILKNANRYQRSDLLVKAGWATMPGASQPDHAVANACVEKLAIKF
jgi:pimeloyl-ACP methyl ester carboxylesterase